MRRSSTTRRSAGRSQPSAIHGRTSDRQLARFMRCGAVSSSVLVLAGLVVRLSPVIAAQPAASGQLAVPAAMVRELMLAHDAGQDSTAVARWRRRVAADRPLTALLDGTVHRLAFRYAAALARYAEAAADAGGITGAYARFGQVAVYANRGELAPAQDLLDSLVQQLAVLDDRAGLAEARLVQASLALRTAGPDSAAALVRAARAAWSSPDEWWAVRADCAEQLVAVRRGDTIADAAWEQLHRRARAAGPRLRAECLFAQAQYVERQGLGRAALPVLTELADVQRTARLWPGLSATYQWRAGVETSRGLYADARADLDSALRYAELGGSPAGTAWARYEAGRIAQRLGFVDEARAHFARARTSFAAMGERTGLAMTERALAEAALLQGDLPYADSALRVSAALYDAVVPANRLAGLVARAEIARRQHQLALATTLLDSAAALSIARNLPGWMAEVRYQRGLHHLTAGRHAAALQEWDSLIRVHRISSGPARFEVVSRWAEAEAGAGRIESAWRVMQGAQRDFDRWRLGKPSREDKLAALQDRYLDWDRDLGLATLVAALGNAGRAPEALALAEWRRVRSLEQQALQRGGLVVASGEASALVVPLRADTDLSALDPRRLPSLALARLAADVAVVSYVAGAGDEPTTAFVLTRDTLQVVRLPAIDSLVMPIDRFAAFVAAGRVPDSLAQRLGQALLHPVLAVVPSPVRDLRLVVDGILHALPFAALPTHDGTPLLLTHRLAMAPSVDDALGSVAAVARRGGAPAALLVGPPAVMPPRALEDPAPWPALPGARRELREVAARVGGTVRLEGRAASPEAVLTHVRDGGTIWHVATHAAGEPGQSGGTALVLQPSAGDDGRLSAARLGREVVPFDLVVLSACTSAGGASVVGQAPHGLVSVLLDRGARAVVATRWRVEDAALVPFMAQFYDALRTTGTVAGALHEARRAAYDQGRSPALWAGIEVHGDPTLQITLPPQDSWWSRTISGPLGRWLSSLGDATE